MKLTEQQLAQLFQQSKDTAVESFVDDLNKFSEATEARLNAVEEIADNSTLSASQHIINNMKGWSKAVATEMQTHMKTRFTTQILKWLRPSVAVAAVVTAVYFITPINQQSVEPQTVQISNQLPIQAQKPDRIMYSSSFEKDHKLSPSKPFENKPDVIAKFDFS